MKKTFLIFNFTFCILLAAFPQAGGWVWIHGSNIPNQAANYGVKGVPSPTNVPPAVYEPCEWTDFNGNFWLYGGLSPNTQVQNGLWKYNPVTNEWTWMTGTATVNYPGNYGIQGISSPNNHPPSRAWGAASWVDLQGNLWMFGGGNFSATYADLWKYDISTNEWVWMKGPNVPFPSGTYGTQGVPDTANNPGYRGECTANWTDSNGDLWFFGGQGTGYYNDLWRYNIATNCWTWMKGSQLTAQPGVYGTMGIENSMNTPGARGIYSHWKDNSGNFWLFGGTSGFGGSNFNDLWRFNPVTNNWTWMSGSNTIGTLATYGTKCISSAANMPAARYENRTSWKDQHHNFWVFGGAGGINWEDAWNDLWMYCFLTGEWIWMSGDSYANPAGNWGILGVSSPLNKPEGKEGAVGWADNNGSFYIFGGSVSPWNTRYNDLWKFTIDTACGICPTPNSIEENNFINELLIFPNPTNFSLTISFSSSEKQNIELHIYNTLGEVQLFQSFKTLEKVFTKEINVEKWSEGIYFLQVKTENGNVSRKVIVSHP